MQPRTKVYAPNLVFATDHRKKIFPPFGRQLAERTLKGESPFLVRILVYGPPNYPYQQPRDPWEEARAINASGDRCALVLPSGENPTRFRWPLRGLITVVEHWPSKGLDPIISDLAACLILADAAHIIIRDARFCCTREVLK